MKRGRAVVMGLTGGLLAVSVLVTACDDKKPNLAPVATALASSNLPPPGATVKKFVLDGASKTSIEMEAPKEKIKASTTGATGTFAVDFANLTNSRGEVKIDLTTLAMSTFAEADKNATQTTHARTWLEVADGESGKLDDKTKESNRYAVYAIRSVESARQANVTKIEATKDGGDEIRTVTLTTKGDLLVHGHKAEQREADLEVTFRYDSGAPADKPKAIAIKTRKPFRVVLADHAVQPRDGFGKIAKGSFHLLGTKVAENADISLELRAKPES